VELQNILQIRATSQAVANDVINKAENRNQAVGIDAVKQAVQGENFEEVVGGKIPSTHGSACIGLSTLCVLFRNLLKSVRREWESNKAFFVLANSSLLSPLVKTGLRKM